MTGQPRRRRPHPDARLAAVTERDTDVVAAAPRGTPTRIGAELVMSREGAGCHVSRVMYSGAANRAEALALGDNLGLVDRGPNPHVIIRLVRGRKHGRDRGRAGRALRRRYVRIGCVQSRASTEVAVGSLWLNRYGRHAGLPGWYGVPRRHGSAR